MPLYASFVALQAIDAHSTWRALEHGAVEANPIMKSVAESKAPFLAAKAIGTAATIAISERLRKKNRVAAVMVMVSANVGMTWVAQHNYRAGSAVMRAERLVG